MTISAPSLMKPGWSTLSTSSSWAITSWPTPWSCASRCSWCASGPETTCWLSATVSTLPCARGSTRLRRRATRSSGSSWRCARRWPRSSGRYRRWRTRCWPRLTLWSWPRPGSRTGLTGNRNRNVAALVDHTTAGYLKAYLIVVSLSGHTWFF